VDNNSLDSSSSDDGSDFEEESLHGNVTHMPPEPQVHNNDDTMYEQLDTNDDTMYEQLDANDNAMYEWLDTNNEGLYVSLDDPVIIPKPPGEAG